MAVMAIMAGSLVVAGDERIPSAMPATERVRMAVEIGLQPAHHFRPEMRRHIDQARMIVIVMSTIVAATTISTAIVTATTIPAATVIAGTAIPVIAIAGAAIAGAAIAMAAMVVATTRDRKPSSLFAP
jgi:hypothetical protein